MKFSSFSSCFVHLTRILQGTLFMDSFLKTHTHTHARTHTHTQAHTNTQCRLQNMEYEYERASFNYNGKTRVLPAVNGTKWRKAEQHQIFELSPSKQTSNDHISDGSQSCVITVLCVLSGLEPQPLLFSHWGEKKDFKWQKLTFWRIKFWKWFTFLIPSTAFSLLCRK